AEFPEQRIRDTLIVRAALEGAATRLAAERITEAELAQLEELVQQMELSLARPERPNFDELNFRFHLLIHEISGNALVTELLDKLFAGMRAYRRTQFVPRLDA